MHYARTEVSLHRYGQITRTLLISSTNPSPDCRSVNLQTNIHCQQVSFHPLHRRDPKREECLGLSGGVEEYLRRQNCI